MNTSIHIDDGDFALQDGLIPKNEYSDVYVRTAHPCKDDFITFGKRIGVLPKKLMTTIDMFATEQPEVYELIGNSFWMTRPDACTGSLIKSACTDFKGATSYRKQKRPEQFRPFSIE